MDCFGQGLLRLGKIGLSRPGLEFVLCTVVEVVVDVVVVVEVVAVVVVIVLVGLVVVVDVYIDT